MESIFLAASISSQSYASDLRLSTGVGGAESVPPVVPDLKPLVDKLKNTVRLQTKNELSIKVSVGKENIRV